MGNVVPTEKGGLPSTSEGDFKNARQSFLHRKFVWQCSWQLQIPILVVQSVLHKKIAVTCLQISVCSKDLPTRQYSVFRAYYICCGSSGRRWTFLKKVMFTNKATFHINGVVNKQDRHEIHRNRLQWPNYTVFLMMITMTMMMNKNKSDNNSHLKIPIKLSSTVVTPQKFAANFLKCYSSPPASEATVTGNIYLNIL
jgi:hypothetical protein